ncbi:sugar ABC transporter ATP-binding protein [Thermotoga sp. KOL6]|uniref:sugar ABC transporter ATP-binding protein n=1 Tax=Thermotoga sp. KOL6 TaxID=126741 RepID=UPI000C784D4C|nr:sugar ABC transporter ATP-binding protein [Thermotoga sp. KOL6]PLV60440.1 D-ribose transporter ATP-binding protein [Thermotoga sp. KOL6]
MKPILEVRNIHKRFPGVHALKGVSLEFYPGEVHAIVGENGAGKSTLMKVISGVYQPDEGEIIYERKKVRWNHPSEAIKAGIVTVFQELSVMDNLSVAENMFMGDERKKFMFVNYKKMYEEAKKFMKNELDIDIDPQEKLGRYSIAIQQMVEIGRALYKKAKVLILDEPTSSLTQKETEKLFEVVKKLKERGVAVLFISHRLEEIFEISDRVTVLRDGEHIGTDKTENLTKEKIVEMMVGRKLEKFYIKERHEPGEVILEVKNLSGEGFENVSFSLRKGEILGFAGLVGAGRTELMETIFGFRPKKSGEVYVEGQKVEIDHPLKAIENGIGFVPEDRKRLGLILIMSIMHNVSLPSLDRIKKGPFISFKREKELAEWAIETLDIRPPYPDRKVLYLSGGNQQKVVVAKWLALKPKILILDEPTRGIDVGAKAEIYKIMSELAKEGVGVIMVSSELPEILQMSDRIAVMSFGKLAGIIDAKEATQEKIMKLAAGVEVQ